jgi:radical SAM superfamily enzyme YgiQ (UPF0313 family)
MKYCLIDPETNANTNVPNIGLAYISAALIRLGVSHKIVDQDIKPFPKDRFKKVKADKYGISVKFNVLHEAERITELLGKERVLWGGPYVRNVDVEVEFIRGYWDQILLETNNLDDLPFPDYDQFDSKEFIEDNFKTGYWFYPLMTSRGCPFQCIFCSSDKKFNKRSAKNCLDEIEHAIKKYKIKAFQILDDNFIMDKSRALEFCEGVKKFNLKWMCPNGIRADMFDYEIGIAMKESGCFHISFGIESIDNKVLKEIKKGETFEQIEKAVILACKLGFSVNGFFILGLPGSSYESDLASYEWAKTKGIKAHFGILVPITGTPLERSEDYKKFINYEILSKALFFDDKNEMVVAYETPEYPKEKRIELYNKIMGFRK